MPCTVRRNDGIGLLAFFERADGDAVPVGFAEHVAYALSFGFDAVAGNAHAPEFNRVLRQSPSLEKTFMDTMKLLSHE